MNAPEPLLKIRFEGQAVGASRIRVSHLLHFLSNFNKALHRTGRVLAGDSQSARKGHPLPSIKDEIALDLVMLTEGSPAAVIGLERHQEQPLLPDMDVGLQILKSALHGLTEIQTDGDAQPLPRGYDAGVLMAWRDAGILFDQGVTLIGMTLRENSTSIHTTFDRVGYERIQQRIQGPRTNIRVIEGRLLMADFKEHGTRCRVHPSAGEPVLCLFDEARKDEVLENILQYVHIVGEARENPLTGRIASIKVHDIERLEGRDHDAADLLPRGSPLSRGFWESPTLEELAASQHVQPFTDISSILGTWPGDDGDGFESAIEDLRHHGVGGVTP